MLHIYFEQAIDKKIMAHGYGVISAEIATVDTQESYGGGVHVLVTGYLTGRDGVKRTFTQTFFLAPQETGYFVLNDMFRYVNEAAVVHGNQILANNIQVPVITYQGKLNLAFCICLLQVNISLFFLMGSWFLISAVNLRVP